MKKKYLTSIFALTIIVGLTACGAVKNDSVLKSENSSLQSGKYFFTANEGGGISKVDAAQNKVIASISVKGMVHNVQVSPNGKVLGATVVPDMGTDNSMKEHAHENSNKMKMKMNGYAVFYDTDSNNLLKKVEVGAHPAHIVFTPDGKYVLVTNNEDNNVTVMDATTYKKVAEIPTGQGPHGFRITADGKLGYVANMNEDTVSVIDLQSMKEKKKIKVGKNPVTTAITSDGKKLVVTLNAENAVSILDLENEKIIKVPVGVGPAQVYIQSDDKYALVANQGTEKKPSNSISKIDLSTLQVVATITTGKGSHGIVTSPDNKYVYVTNMFENTVSIVDNEKNKEMNKVSVGETPNGISVLP